MKVDLDGTKADRALVLKEQGLTRAEISERLGVKPTNVGGMLLRARHRRATLEVNRILERTAQTAEKVAG